LATAYRIEAAAALQAALAIEQHEEPAEVRHKMRRHVEGAGEATDVLSAVIAAQRKRGIA
jgi:hypothetical protein